MTCTPNWRAMFPGASNSTRNFGGKFQEKCVGELAVLVDDRDDDEARATVMLLQIIHPWKGAQAGAAPYVRPEIHQHDLAGVGLQQ